MKKYLTHTFKALTLVGATILPHNALAADLACNLNVAWSGTVNGNGTAFCEGLDYTFGNSTTGSFFLKNVTKPIHSVTWNGDANCGSTATFCPVTVFAYFPSEASATILYTDGTWETTNTATIDYESGF